MIQYLNHLRLCFRYNYIIASMSFIPHHSIEISIRYIFGLEIGCTNLFMILLEILGYEYSQKQYTYLKISELEAVNAKKNYCQYTQNLLFTIIHFESDYLNKLSLHLTISKLWWMKKSILLQGLINFKKKMYLLVIIIMQQIKKMNKSKRKILSDDGL